MSPIFSSADSTTRSLPTSPLSGGCQCGALRYRIDGLPQTIYACHCLECQHQSSSGFGISTWINAAEFTFVSGKPGFYLTTGGSGAAKSCAYCRDCGSRIYHRGGGSAGRDPLVEGDDGILSLKAGSLDDTDWFHPIAHLWMIRAQPWMRELIALHAASTDNPPLQFDREPDDEVLAARWQAWLNSATTESS